MIPFPYIWVTILSIVLHQTTVTFDYVLDRIYEREDPKTVLFIDLGASSTRASIASFGELNSKTIPIGIYIHVLFLLFLFVLLTLVLNYRKWESVGCKLGLPTIGTAIGPLPSSLLSRYSKAAITQTTKLSRRSQNQPESI